MNINPDLNYLDRLESESIYILREVVSSAKNPAMLYSIGKDSSVILHLARKAFYPANPPFPLLHIDTQWKFQEMYQFRDLIARESGLEMLVYINPDGKKNNINPLVHGSAVHTDVMKTQALKLALDFYKFDITIAGARRDEEKSRSKERIFSFRDANHAWDPKNQRPELWHIFNGTLSQDQSIRAFPLSNWTEIDVWNYIKREEIPVVPLYFAADRPVVERDGSLIMVNDERFILNDYEEVLRKKVRFRTLGCYPLTGGIESNATSVEDILQELNNSKFSERQGRTIDNDNNSSMEKKKRDGYF